MRERTTWNRDDIQKRASALKVAEDPRAMNQDHLQRQPAADKYLTGDPSTFAEDVHPSGKNWKAEYSDGTTSRNEIGMPEMRDDTFNHPETDPGSSPARGGGRQASALDEETLVKKADVCCKIARRMLGSKATEASVEDQALALMNLSDSDLIATATRMAAQGDDEGQGQDQQKQAQDQDQGQDDQGQKQAQDQGQDDQAQGQKQAQGKKDLPPEFLENIEKKKEEAKDKEASKKLSSLEQMAQQLQTMAQQVQQLMQQQQAGYQQQQAQQVQQEQVQQAGQQQEQQALDQMLQQDQQANDQMIDQMLAQGQQGQPAPQMANDFGVQLDSPVMDIGEAQMGPEDDVLSTLFANNQEVQNAQTAHQLQHGAPAPMQVQASQPMARTASRTVGTRPTGGVSQLGGLGATAPASGGDVEKLSNLWNSAPDVSDVFRS